MDLAVGVVLLTVAVILCIYTLSRRAWRLKAELGLGAETAGARRVFVVVLGDIGRSPRMQYHAVSLADAGLQVYLVGYAGSNPVEAVRAHRSIYILHLPAVPGFTNGLPKLLALLAKVIWQTVTLILCLLVNRRPSHILIQNPPSLPTMSVCYAVGVLRRSRLVTDWHNYGYTILSLGLGPRHPLVRIYQSYERCCGRLSSANICVTCAMREDLRANWDIKAVTMHDRPPAMFHSLSLEEKHQLFLKLSIFHDQAANGDAGETTMFTLREPNGSVFYRSDRPVLLVSSTSWTEDEDFSLLLKALDEYDAISSGRESGDRQLPRLVCIITGKGPLKAHYAALIGSRRWTKVSVDTPWLEAEDYPRLLACADLGVCLHRSSSGLDLPMKVVDMFGCGLPVCALHFSCLDELVVDGRNGLVFHDDSQLALQLQSLLADFPNGCKRLNEFRQNLASFQRLRWTEAWNLNVLPIFNSA